MLRTDGSIARAPSGHIEELAREIPGELQARLAALAEQEATAISRVLLAGFGVVLGLFNGQKDFCIGLATSSGDADAATRVPPQPFACRIRLSAGSSFLDLLKATCSAGPEAKSSDAAWRGVVFGFADADAQPSIEDPGARSHLQLRIVSGGCGIRAVWCYNAALFHRGTIEQLSDRYVELLRQIAAQPDRPLSNLTIVPLRWQPGEILPCSPAQLAIWRHLRAQPQQRRSYSISTCVELTGNIDRALFVTALQEVVRTTSALRLQLVETSCGIQQRIVAAEPFEVPFLDFATSADGASAAHAWMMRERLVTLDLAAGERFRFALLKVAGDRYYWFSQYHHLLVDGAGQQFINQRVARAYSSLLDGNAVPLANDCEQYVEYIRSETQYGYSWKYLEDRQYWQRFPAQPHPLTLSSGAALPTIEASPVESALHRLPAPLVAAISRSAERAAMPLQHFMIAAVVGYLFRVSGSAPVTIGLPVHGRPFGPSSNVVAVCANVLPQRFLLGDGWSFREFLEHVKAQLLAAMTHRRFRIEEIRGVLNTKPGSKLFNVVVNVLPVPESLAFGAATGAPRSLTPGYVDDLTIWIFAGERRGQLSLKLDGNRARYAAWELSCHAAALQTWLTNLTADIDRPLLDLPLTDGHASHAPRGGGARSQQAIRQMPPVHELFEARCDASEHATAVTLSGQRLSYRELEERANQVAHRLAGMAIGAGALVAVHADRSVEAIIGLLGVMKAGAAYLPLDPSYPRKRIGLILQDARPAAVLTQRHLFDEALAAQMPVVYFDDASMSSLPKTRVSRCTRSDALAYCIYTSGSTGNPKGVAIEHKSLSNHCMAMVKELALTSSDHVLQFSSIGFDASLEEIFPSLMAGARLILQPRRLLTTDRFLELLAAEEISVLNLPMAYFERLIADLSAQHRRLPPRTRLVVVGGDKLTLETFRRWRALHMEGVELLNTYGPTEATISCTAYRAHRGVDALSVPIGRPIDNVAVHVLDERRNPLPPGLAGELCIGGLCVARGYLHREELNTERFIPDPFTTEAGARLYRSGDIGRYLPDGNLEFLGRSDQQVKINGCRIQLEEIEALLDRHEWVHKSAAAARAVQGSKRIIAYVVLSNPERHDLRGLKAYLREYLPAYMLPAQFVVVPELPITIHGKLDRAALPPPSDQDVLRVAFEPPANSLENTVARVWSSVLNVRTVGRHDNFYDLGGSSLLALEARMSLEESLGQELPAGLFEDVTLKEVAAQVAAPLAGPTHAEQLRFFELDCGGGD